MLNLYTVGECRLQQIIVSMHTVNPVRVSRELHARGTPYWVTVTEGQGQRCKSRHPTESERDFHCVCTEVRLRSRVDEKSVHTVRLVAPHHQSSQYSFFFYLFPACFSFTSLSSFPSPYSLDRSKVVFVSFFSITQVLHDPQIYEVLMMKMLLVSVLVLHTFISRGIHVFININTAVFSKLLWDVIH